MSGTQALSIWQYGLLGGPPQTYAAYSDSILKHRENYVDLLKLKSPYCAVGGYYDGDPFSALPVESGRVVSHAFSVSISIRPSIISVILIVLYIAQLVLATMCGATISMGWPKGPRLLTWYSLSLAIGFTAALGGTLYYWAVDADYRAYVPLVTGSGMGFLTNWSVLLLLCMWTIDQSGLPTKASEGEERVRIVALCIAMFVMSLGSVTGYGNALVHGYQQYISRFGEVRTFIANQCYQERAYAMEQDAYYGSGGGGEWDYGTDQGEPPVQEKPPERVDPPVVAEGTQKQTKGKRVHENPFEM
jgi:hypothetical protein